VTPRTVRVTTAVAVVCLAACGPRPRTPRARQPTPEEIATRFERALGEGCYLCLDDALRDYRALAPAVQDLAPVQLAAARVALVWMIREKELGLVDQAARRAAHAIVERAAAASPDLSQDLSVADALPWNGSGAPPDEAAAARRAPAPDFRNWRDALASRWAQDPVDAYVYLSIQCSIFEDSGFDPAPVAAHFPKSALVQYRFATCAADGQDALERLLAAHPRFIELDYFLGQYHRNSRQPDDAIPLFVRAFQGIPGFTAAEASAADTALQIEEYQQALDFADLLLAHSPALWRVVTIRLAALSQLGRHEEAIDLAKRMIGASNSYLGDAYFWLAWNERQLNELPAALADAQTAKQFEASTRVFLLAGLVRLGLAQWTDARREFLEVVRDASVCDGHLGLAEADGALTLWKDAAEAYGRAERCFETAEAALQRQIAGVPPAARGIGPGRPLARAPPRDGLRARVGRLQRGPVLRECGPDGRGPHRSDASPGLSPLRRPRATADRSVAAVASFRPSHLQPPAPSALRTLRPSHLPKPPRISGPGE
jgi:tetratricopeptide (TPR) repeat protein